MIEKMKTVVEALFTAKFNSSNTVAAKGNRVKRTCKHAIMHVSVARNNNGDGHTN